MEKGRDLPDTPTGERLNRKTWDWAYLMQQSNEVSSSDVAIAAGALGGPVNIRIRRRDKGWPEHAWLYRAFSFVDGAWYERWVGRTDVTKIADYIRQLDPSAAWGYVAFARDLGPTEADGMLPANVADTLLGFSPLRERLRGR